MKKVIFIKTENGRAFEVDALEVANDRANYYANRDYDYEEEFLIAMNDDQILEDWLLNNCDFYMFESCIEVRQKQKDISELEIERVDVIIKEA